MSEKKYYDQQIMENVNLLLRQANDFLESANEILSLTYTSLGYDVRKNLSKKNVSNVDNLCSDVDEIINEVGQIDTNVKGLDGSIFGNNSQYSIDNEKLSLASISIPNSTSTVRKEIEETKTNDKEMSPPYYITQEKIESTYGTLSFEEYNLFIEGTINYNNKQIEIANAAKEKLEYELNEIDSFLTEQSQECRKVKDFENDAFNAVNIFTSKEENLKSLYEFSIDNGLISNNINFETFKSQLGESSIYLKIELISEWEKAQGINEDEISISSLKKSFEEKVLKELNEMCMERLGTDYYTLCEQRNNLVLNIENLEQAIGMWKSEIESAPFDYLYMLKDYDAYVIKEIEGLKDKGYLLYDEVANKYVINQESMDRIYNMLLNEGNSFSYNNYVDLYNRQITASDDKLSESEYLILMSMVGQSSNNLGIEDSRLDTMAEAYLNYPTQYGNFLKTYFYIKEHPETFPYLCDSNLASEENSKNIIKFYLEKCNYELISVQAQMDANRFLKSLNDGEDFWDIVENQGLVSLSGLGNGLGGYIKNVFHIFDAFATIFTGNENREQSVDELTTICILQALMSDSEKVECGLIGYDEFGKKVNKTNSIVDMTIDYSGLGLDLNYKISRGIGNMLPSIGFGAIDPFVGMISIALASAGNAYHGAMVDGHSFWGSLLYGIYSGVSEVVFERVLGALPFISNIQITSIRTYLNSIGSEGLEEGIQYIADSIVGWTFMGEEMPSTVDEWLKFSGGLGKNVMIGAVTAGILNVPRLVSARSNTTQSFDDLSLKNSNSLDDYDGLSHSDFDSSESIVVYINGVQCAKIEESYEDLETAVLKNQNVIIGLDGRKPKKISIENQNVYIET